MVSIQERFRRSNLSPRRITRCFIFFLADFREECEPLPQERVMQGLRDGAPLTQELTDERLHKLGHGGTVVDMPWGQPTGQPCTLMGIRFRRDTQLPQ